MYALMEAVTNTLKLVESAMQHRALNSEVILKIEENIKSKENGIRSLRKKLDKVQLVSLEERWSKDLPSIQVYLSYACRLDIQAKDQDTKNYVQKRVGDFERIKLNAEKDPDLYSITATTIAAKAEGIERLSPLYECRNSAPEAETFDSSRSGPASAWWVSAVYGLNKIVALLVEQGAGVDEGNEFDRSALHAAATCGHYTATRLLSKGGADFTRRDRFGVPPLIAAAAWAGWEDFPQLLLQYDFERQKQSNIIKGALEGASLRGHLKTLQVLMNKSVDLEARYLGGRGLLHVASFGGSRSSFRDDHTKDVLWKDPTAVKKELQDREFVMRPWRAERQRLFLEQGESSPPLQMAAREDRELKPASNDSWNTVRTSIIDNLLAMKYPRKRKASELNGAKKKGVDTQPFRSPLLRNNAVNLTTTGLYLFIDADTLAPEGRRV
ncbi:hypothetical protein OEA41_010536 [Lepraria neglecta]|uniref:Uncharacterized protein n=1 Tax=Lepraria neglecta TaxID=209136 RepID=A0AAE0DFD8_9LECA|nr:hypothetical protein OEA41_010536 [Lepraria neglecta]